MPQSSLASYASFLSLLLTLGPKLQTLWPKVQSLIAAVNELIDAVKSAFPAAEPASPGTLSDFHVSTSEAEMETAIAGHIAGAGGAFDGSVLRNIWGFAQKHPELLSLLLSLLKGG